LEETFSLREYYLPLDVRRIVRVLSQKETMSSKVGKLCNRKYNWEKLQTCLKITPKSVANPWFTMYSFFL
jgi:hypothetical protein